MGQALLFILIASILPFGGILEDPSAGVEDPAIQGVDVQVSDEGASAKVDAPTETAGSDVALEASASGSGAKVTLADASVDAAPDHIVLQAGDALIELPIEIPRLPGVGDHTVIFGYSEDGLGSTGSASMQSLVVAPETSAQDALPAEDLATRAAGAAALAAIAVMHVEPSPRGLKRFLPLLPLYSRISRDEVLDHETRENIYGLLKEDPGLSLAEISEELDLSRSTARHHLRVLEDADMVGHETRGRCRVHFPVGRREEAVRGHLLANETRQRILELVVEEPASLVQLSRKLDANPGAVDFHLKKLVEAGVIERYENGSITYRPGTQFRPV